MLLLQVAALSLTALAPSQETPPLPTITLVESAPADCGLDHPDIPNFADVWLTAIKGAKSHIELAHFYASDAGELGATDPAHPTQLTPVIAALEAAAKRGVQIRWLADAQFAKTYPALLERFEAQKSFEVQRYWMPLIEQVEYAPGLGIESEIRIEPRFGPAAKDEPRAGVMHAKYMLVDGTEVIFGSANFDWRSLQHIQELGCHIVDPSGNLATPFQDVFELDWFYASGATTARPAAHALSDHEAGDESNSKSHATTRANWLEPKNTSTVSSVDATPVFSPRGLLPDETQWDLPQLVARIDAAKTRVWVQVLTYRATGYHDYFGTLEDALRRAAARGVDVRLLVADWGKRSSVAPGLKSLTVLPHIEVRFASIPEDPTGHIPFARVIHSKYMVVDADHAWVGTSNWERGYFESSRNVGLLLDAKAPAKQLATFFEGTWNSDFAEPVDPGKEYEPRKYGE